MSRDAPESMAELRQTAHALKAPADVYAEAVTAIGILSLEAARAEQYDDDDETLNLCRAAIGRVRGALAALTSEADAAEVERLAFRTANERVRVE